MLGPVQLCQDPQAQFTLLRESLGVSRVNHTSRVLGHMFLTEETAANTSDEVGQGSPERLFPGFTEDSAQQATLSAGQAGAGCKRSIDVARPAHLGEVIAARLRINDMIRDATFAGLMAVQPLLTRMDA